MEREKIKVTIIIPIFNSEKYLEECLSSVMNQSFKDLEILLIDDGSTDASGRICDKYAQKDERFKVFHRLNEGVSSARNFALDIANGEYIAFVDSDDSVNENFIEVLVKGCLEKDADIVYCDVKNCTKVISNELYKKELKDFDVKTVEFDGDYALAHFYETWMNPVIWNKLVKKKLFEGLRFPNIERAEDFWMVIQLILRAEKIVGYKGAKLYYYRCHNESIMSKIKVDSLCDFDVRLQIYEILKQKKCRNTMKKLSDQTLRFFLDFLLAKKV